MKLSKKDQGLLLMFCGILFVIVTYFFAYKKLLDKTALVETENNNLQKAITKLEELQDNREFYEAETERFQKENAEMKNAYPSAIMNADKILFAKKLEDRFGLYVTYLGLQDMQNVDVAYPAVDQVSVNALAYGQTAPVPEANPNGIYLFSHGVELNFETSYTGIKGALQYIVDDTQQKTIHSLALSYNEDTGVLSGSLTASMYSMTGTKAIYNRPDFTGIETGTDDIFKTFEKYLNVNVEENAEEE